MNRITHRKPKGSASSALLLNCSGSTAHAAFTLIELLIVVAIIAILAALLLASLSQAKTRGQTISCINNIKQLSTAWHLYANEHNDFLVPNWPAPSAWVDAFVPTERFPAGATNLAHLRNGLLYPYL